MLRLLTSTALATMFLTGVTNAQDVPPAEAFAAPAVQWPQLSPDGERLAFFSNEGERSAVIILDIESGDQVGVGTTEMKAADLEWGGDDYVLVEVQQTGRLTNYSARHDVELGSFFAIPADDPSDIQELLRDSGNIHPGRVQYSHFYGWDQENDRVIMGAYNTTGEVNSFSHIGGGNTGGVQDSMFHLWSVNPENGRARRVSRALSTTRKWFVGTDGQAIARAEYDDLRNIFRLDEQVEGDWSNTLTHEMELVDLWPVGIPLDGDGVLLRAYSGNNQTLSLYRVGENGRWRDQPIFSDPNLDLSYIIRDPYTLRVAGVAIEEEATTRIWFDETLTAYQDALADALQVDNIEIVSWSQDKSDFLILLNPGNEAPLYMLFDAEASQVSPFRSVYPGLANYDLPNRVATTYTASDGTEIPAYLTLPEGEGPFPMVIYPHGGPWDRDTGGFDNTAHFLATRGFAVLQPNFRGSSGYGWEWEAAGFGEQGLGVMQSDLSDGVQAMIDGNIADPDRVCIVGWSYGGYAALAGAAFTPDLYACAASIAGVSDYSRRLGQVAMESSVESSGLQDYRRRLGLGEGDTRETLDASAPAKHVEAIRAPILLIHGEDDLNVPIEQSEYMADALERVGAEFEFVRLETGDHDMTYYRDRLRVLQELERFLGTHIGD
jgi:dipeptidyl aminopeptidase/acylaminoacyl peptidase